MELMMSFVVMYNKQRAPMGLSPDDPYLVSNAEGVNSPVAKHKPPDSSRMRTGFKDSLSELRRSELSLGVHNTKSKQPRRLD